jgi:hypothetical protein
MKLFAKNKGFRLTFVRGGCLWRQLIGVRRGALKFVADFDYFTCS